MASIKNIIFDLGNVLLNLDFDNTERQFQTLLEDEFEQVYKGLQKTGHFKAHETGQISDEAFINGIKDASTKNLTEQQVVDAWNGMLLDIPAHRLEMLKHLSKNYHLYLLSNTNAVHLAYIGKRLQLDHLMSLNEFNSLFIKAYYSHLIKMRKPGTAIFEFVLSDANLTPEETLFIDDSLPNIEGANEVGIKGYHHTVGAEIADLIDELL